MRHQNREILVTLNGNQFTTLRQINRVAERSSNHPFVTSSIERYKLGNDPNSLERIFKAAFNLATFQPDPPSRQYIRTLNRLLKDRVANCVDYTVFVSAFLRRLNIPHKIRMVSFEAGQPQAYSHIYPVTLNDIVLDVVYGQDQHGGEQHKKKRTPYFNHEVPFEGKFDKLIR